MTGYEALRSRAAWLDLSARGKIKLTGEDRARLLHAMTTNHIQQLTPGTGCYAFFLNDKGRVLSDANVLCRPDHFLLDVEPETREPLYQHLDRYIIADDVTLEDVTDATATIAVEGPEAAEVLQRAGAPIPEAEYSSVDWADSVVARLNSTGEPGFFIFAPRRRKSRADRASGSRRRRARRCRSGPRSASGTRQAALWRGHQRAVSGAGSESAAGAALQQGLLPGAGDRGARSLARADPSRAEAAHSGNDGTAGAWNEVGGRPRKSLRRPIRRLSAKLLLLAYVRSLVTRCSALSGIDKYPTMVSFFTSFTTSS